MVEIAIARERIARERNYAIARDRSSKGVQKFVRQFVTEHSSKGAR